MDLVEKVRIYVEDACRQETNIFGMDAYNNHFVSMVNYAIQLAEETGADREIVGIAAWLHDIGSIIGEYEQHHIIGAEHARTLLTQYLYPNTKIEQVEHCILAHRGSKSIPRQTLEAECISDADAMSHFDNVGALFNLAYNVRKMDVEEAVPFVRKKLERSWNKLTPRAKQIIEPKYQAVKLLFDE